MLYSHNLLPVITKPTRITSHTATLIDDIYTHSVNRLISGVMPVDISDHLPIFCTVERQIVPVDVLLSTMSMFRPLIGFFFSLLGLLQQLDQITRGVFRFGAFGNHVDTLRWITLRISGA